MKSLTLQQYNQAVAFSHRKRAREQFDAIRKVSEKQIYTPADNAAELAAIEKRNRKHARKMLNAATVRHTIEPKRVIRP